MEPTWNLFFFNISCNTAKGYLGFVVETICVVLFVSAGLLQTQMDIGHFTTERAQYLWVKCRNPPLEGADST